MSYLKEQEAISDREKAVLLIEKEAGEKLRYAETKMNELRADAAAFKLLISAENNKRYKKEAEASAKYVERENKLNELKSDITFLLNELRGIQKENERSYNVACGMKIAELRMMISKLQDKINEYGGILRKIEGCKKMHLLMEYFNILKQMGCVGTELAEVRRFNMNKPEYGEVYYHQVSLKNEATAIYCRLLRLL